MSDQEAVVVDVNKMVVISPTEPQEEEHKKLQDTPVKNGTKEIKNDEENEEEPISSAHLESGTLPWPEDQHRKPLLDQDGGISEPQDGACGKDPMEVQSQTESEVISKSKWRESMPEGERWRDDEVDGQRNGKINRSLPDDDDEEQQEKWMSEKAALSFSPNVMIVNASKDAFEERRYFAEQEAEETRRELNYSAQFYPDWEEQDEKYYICGEDGCSEKLKLVLAMLAAGLLFPFLVWGGYALLPFDSPLLNSGPLRVLYTLRCSFFAIVPILLGVVVQGVARLRYSALKPLYQSHTVNQEVSLHWHYVNESLVLFLFYFLQLAVLATYISQDLVKLVPLLTIVFVFGRLIYWLCLSFGSTVRAFGFGFSFLPILVMLGGNLYYICSSDGQESLFEVAPPITEAPPRQRFWG